MRSEQAEPPVAIGQEATPHRTSTGLELHQLLPPFKLETTDGHNVSPWDYKGKKNLILLFCDIRSSSDLEMLATLKGSYGAIADENIEVLAITDAPVDEVRECGGSLGLPFPVLCDTEGRVRAQYWADGATLLAADRFGEPKLQSAAGTGFDTVLANALTVLELSELECPECGVPTWPVNSD